MSTTKEFLQKKRTLTSPVHLVYTQVCSVPGVRVPHLLLISGEYSLFNCIHTVLSVYAPSPRIMNFLFFLLIKVVFFYFYYPLCTQWAVYIVNRAYAYFTFIGERINGAMNRFTYAIIVKNRC